jgi:hypothetical protein
VATLSPRRRLTVDGACDTSWSVPEVAANGPDDGGNDDDEKEYRPDHVAEVPGLRLTNTGYQEHPWHNSRNRVGFSDNGEQQGWSDA